MVKKRTGRVETVDTMFARYPDEWIYFEVMEDDKYERPTKGILIAHHRDRKGLHELIMQNKVTHGAVFYTGSIVPKGHEVLPSWLFATPSFESQLSTSLPVVSGLCRRLDRVVQVTYA